LVFEIDVKQLMPQMNADLASAANESGSQYLDDVLQIEWTGADFVDNGHFSPSGSHKFARAISKKCAADPSFGGRYSRHRLYARLAATNVCSSARHDVSAEVAADNQARPDFKNVQSKRRPIDHVIWLTMLSTMTMSWVNNGRQR